MPKRGLLVAALWAGLAFPALAEAGVALAPGITYDRQLLFNAGRPVVLHVVRTPPPSDLYRLRPVLSGGTVTGGRSVPAMQARLSPRATAVGVNGDFFSLQGGYPSGIFMRDGVMSARPNRQRSALALGLDGRLVVDRFGFVGTWQAGTGKTRTLGELNRPLGNPPRVGLFTGAWGDETPRVRGSVDVVLTGVPRTRLDADLIGTVVEVTRGGRAEIPAGGAVLQAVGTARSLLLAEATVGSTVTIRLGANGLPPGTLDAIGGGPALVRDGSPVRDAGEAFTAGQLAWRHPRTAVGQAADGGLLFVVADGRSSRSYGLTTRAMARVMADLGSVTAMAFDGGGSSTLAFDGRVLNRPSDGRPRRVADGLFVLYHGIYAPGLTGSILSPNGDGVGDRKVLAAKVVRESELSLRLVRPDGSVAWRREDVVGPGWVRRVVSDPAMVDGRWRWVVEAIDSETGQQTGMARAFRVNKTLGHLELSQPRMRVWPRKGGRLRASVVLARRARLAVVVVDAAGRVRRVLFKGARGAGKQAWSWDGRTRSGRVVKAGTFTIRVTARNDLGSVGLRRSVRVLRPSRR